MATNKGKPVKGRRIADIQPVDNQQRHPAAASEYHHLRGQTAAGDELDFLFTELELHRARRRALRNPEDIPKVALLRDIFD